MRVTPLWSCTILSSCILVPSCTLALTCTLVPTCTLALHADHTFALSVGRMGHCLLNSCTVHRSHPHTPQWWGKQYYPCASNPYCQPHFHLASCSPQTVQAQSRCRCPCNRDKTICMVSDVDLIPPLDLMQAICPASDLTPPFSAGKNPGKNPATLHADSTCANAMQPPFPFRVNIYHIGLPSIKLNSSPPISFMPC